MPTSEGQPTEREWLEGERYEDKFPTSSEGKRWVIWSETLVSGDGEIPAEGIEVAPASEVERLREALRQMTGASAQLEPRAAKIARAALADEKEG